MKWKWIDADCTSVTTAEGTLTLKGLFIPLFIEQLLMNMTGTVNTLMLGHYADDAVAAVGAANQVIGFLYTFMRYSAAAHRSSSATDWGREMKKGRRMQRLPPSCAEVQSA